MLFVKPRPGRGAAVQALARPGRPLLHVLVPEQPAGDDAPRLVAAVAGHHQLLGELINDRESDLHLDQLGRVHVQT